VAQVVAHILNIDLELVSVKPSNNLASPNGMGTAASITSEACAYVSIEIGNTLVFIFLL
jgi:xanthine dehydrogenase molybdopterin-binding subunit B